MDKIFPFSTHPLPPPLAACKIYFIGIVQPHSINFIDRFNRLIDLIAAQYSPEGVYRLTKEKEKRKKIELKRFLKSYKRLKIYFFIHYHYEAVKGI